MGDTISGPCLLYRRRKAIICTNKSLVQISCNMGSPRIMGFLPRTESPMQLFQQDGHFPSNHRPNFDDQISHSFNRNLINSTLFSNRTKLSTLLRRGRRIFVASFIISTLAATFDLNFISIPLAKQGAAAGA